LKTKKKPPSVSKDEMLDKIAGVNVPDEEYLREKFLEMVDSIVSFAPVAQPSRHRFIDDLCPVR
jgi:hypothetical protein